MEENRITQAKEIVPSLILGGLQNLSDILRTDADIFLPLERLQGDIPESGFQGEILCYPIPGQGILPGAELEELVEKLVHRIRGGRHIAVLDAGENGRTGCVAACVLFQLGIEDPLVFLRENSGPCAVKTREQERAVELFCQRHIAGTYWHCKSVLWKVRLRNAWEAYEDVTVQKTVREINEDLGPKARFLVRWSGVEPLVRVLAEAPEESLCEKAFAGFKEALRAGGYLEE